MTLSVVMQGNVYRPNVVRIGSEEAPVSQRARDVWVDLLIARYTDMDPATWQRRLVSCCNAIICSAMAYSCGILPTCCEGQLPHQRHDIDCTTLSFDFRLCKLHQSCADIFVMTVFPEACKVP